MGNRAKKIAKSVIAVIAWIALWALAAEVIHQPLILVGPVDVACTLAEQVVTASFWEAIAKTFLHIALGALVACVLGCALGFAAALWQGVQAFITPAMSFIKSAPIVCFIVLVLVWVGATWVDAFAVVFAVTPVFYTSMLTAWQQRNCALHEMMQLLRVRGMRFVRIYVWPSVRPFFIQSTQVAVGMAWKSGVTAELIGLTYASIGEKIYLGKLSLDIASLLAWTIVIVLLSWLCEQLVIALTKVRLRSYDSVDQVLCTEGAKKNDAAAAGAQTVSKETQDNGILAEQLPASIDKGQRKETQNNGILVELRKVTKRFDEKVVLKEFDFCIREGERVCVMAPTGEGKTTLLRMLMGLEQPTQGEACSGDVCFCPAFQESTLLPWYTARENLLLVSPAPDALLVRLLGENAAKNACSRQPSELSGGTKRCVELCRALLAPGDIVVLDEPFAGMDDATRDRAYDLIEQELQGRALVFATHDARDAASLRARLVTLTKVCTTE